MNLDYFKDIDAFYNGLQTLFNDLNIPINYIDEKSIAPAEILTNTFKGDNAAHKLMDDVFILGMVDDAAFNGVKSADISSINADYDGVIIFGVTLKKRDKGLLPTRSQLAHITRAFNREFHYTPVVVVFKYEGYIALANTRRLQYKQAWREGDKAGKVSLLRDIDIENPHTGHLKILQELNIKDKKVGIKENGKEQKHTIDTFTRLYLYWQSVFDVSILNKQFYKELSNWYFWAIDNIDVPDDMETDRQKRNATYIIRMITRIIFIWFLKEKKLVSPELFDKSKLDKILNYTDSSNSTYYKVVLQNLFFATLNVEMEKRKFRKPDEYHGKNHDYMNHNVFRYHTFLKDDNFFRDYFTAIPFLNGGLFDCLDHLDEDKKRVRVDCFSDRDHTRLSVNDDLFFGDEITVDISQYFDSKNEYKSVRVQGLIKLLDSYKFTVDENTPLEEDIALEPELLGRVFENLLASYNPETQNTARKQTGSFYTPREIVDYMVNESLKQYLLETSKLDDKIIDGLVTSSKEYSELQLTMEQCEIVDDALDSIKIVDPACGSGAFPMGILNKLLAVKLTVAEIKRKEAIRLSKTNKEENLYIKKGERIIYKPDDILHVICTYKGGYSFNFAFNGENRGEFKVNDLALTVKKEIRIFNKKRNKSTVANLFSQGRIEDGQTFNSLKTNKNIKRIISGEDENIILWKYKEYNVENKTREYRNSEDEIYDTIIKGEEYSDKTVYQIKKDIIANSIYGVDIQPIAVNISKLRFFLSLLVDEVVDETLPNRGVESLPNLDYKIMQGNSLIEEFEGVKLFDEKLFYGESDEQKKIEERLREINNSHTLDDKVAKTLKNERGKLIKRLNELKSKEKNLVFDETKESLLDDLKRIHKEYFNCENKKEKDRLKKQVDHLEWEMIQATLKEEGHLEALERLKQIRLYGEKPFFLWKLNFAEVFQEKGGFDVVIGNPPYVQIQKFSGQKIQKDWENEKYKTFCKTGDVYSLFYEKGNLLLKENGVLSFITSNKWMRANYGKATRKYFVENTTPLKLIDFCGYKVFESATVNTNILIFQNKSIDQHQVIKALQACTVGKDYFGQTDIAGYLEKNCIILEKLTEDSWIISSKAEQKLKRKIEEAGTPLKEWDVSINYGVKTGFNEAFIISDAKKNELIDKDPKSAEIIKPILRGKDIKKYKTEYADLWLIATFPSLKLNIDKYPAIKEYLKSFGRKLEQTGETYVNENNNAIKCRKRTNNKWFEVQDTIAYYKEFEKEKISWGNLCRNSQFSLVKQQLLLNAPSPLITPASKYILAILNSTIGDRYIRSLGVTRNGGYFEYKPMFVEKLPIPKISNEQQKPFEELVDKIIVKKKKDEDTTAEEREIDEMVYKLYGLTDEEIKIVEGEKK